MDEQKLREAATLLTVRPAYFRRTESELKRAEDLTRRLPRLVKTPAQVTLSLTKILKEVWSIRRNAGASFTGPPRLYREATGFDNDVTSADIAAVRERLEVLATSADDDLDDQRLEQAAFVLLLWTASGRPVEDPRMREAERFFQELMVAQDEPEGQVGEETVRLPAPQLRQHYVHEWTKLLRDPVQSGKIDAAVPLGRGRPAMIDINAGHEHDLREIATRAAVQPSRLNGIGAPLWWVDHLPSVMFRPVTLLIGLGGATKIALRLRGLPDDSVTERLYREATGATRDQAKADLAAVHDRLIRLTTMNEDPSLDYSAVADVAFVLVRWVASGRSLDDPDLVRVEEAYQQLMADRHRSQIPSERRSAGRDDRQRHRQYVEVWTEVLRRS